VRSSCETSATNRRRRESPCLDAVKHRVERQAKLPDFGTGLCPFDAVGAITLGDQLGGSPDGDQRPQSEPDDPEVEQHEAGEDAESDKQLDEEQAMKRAGDRAERGREDECVRCAAVDRSAHPPSSAAAHRRDGQVGDPVRAVVGHRRDREVGRQARAWRRGRAGEMGDGCDEEHLPAGRAHR